MRTCDYIISVTHYDVSGAAVVKRCMNEVPRRYDYSGPQLCSKHQRQFDKGTLKPAKHTTLPGGALPLALLMSKGER